MQDAPATPEQQIPVTRPAPVATKLCKGCGSLLAQSLQDEGAEFHPNCAERKLVFNQTAPEPGTEHPMRTHLIGLIKYSDHTSARSQQRAIGPSEIGGSCDRRLSMRISGLLPVNRTSDPWPAIVGTAMHDWLQRCMERDNRRLVAEGKPPRWITEKRVQADQIIHGTSDVYDTETQTVIDWKSMGKTAEARLIKDGPSDGYQVQINTYGLGFMRAGYPVKRVALMFLPRAGLLSSARYYEWPFEPAMAQAAIDRVYRVGRSLLQLRQEAGSNEVWDRVPADVTALCGWCPFFLRGLPQASSRGCPGK